MLKDGRAGFESIQKTVAVNRRCQTSRSNCFSIISPLWDLYAAANVKAKSRPG
jgi:hypothetical protein